MSHDPGHSDDGNADQGNKRTRLVMRPDVAEPPKSGVAAAKPKGGAVIGTTRLVAAPERPEAAAAGGGIASAGGAAKNQAKTQYVHDASVDIDPVAGWIVVVQGPGRGGFRPVYVGMNSVGRGSNQRIRLDFGDDSISREEHAFITYDDETRTFYLQHGGKSNLVRLAGKPVLQPTELKSGDQFRIGATTFRFVANCGPDFCWKSEVGDE